MTTVTSLIPLKGYNTIHIVYTEIRWELTAG